MKIIDLDKALMPFGQAFTRIKSECGERTRSIVARNIRGGIIRNGYYPVSMLIREKLEELC